MGLGQTFVRWRRGRADAQLLDADGVKALIDSVTGRGGALAAFRSALPHALRLDEPEVWTRLGHVRMAAAEEQARAARPRVRWPPASRDPAPGALIPELTPGELTGERLGGSLLHHGSLLVRGLVDAGTAERLRKSIDVALEACAAHHEDQSKGASRSNHVPFPLAEDEPIAAGRDFMRSGGAVWAAEAPKVLEDILAEYRKRGVLDAVADYLGEAPVLSVGKTVLRRAEPTGGGGDFHQDGAFMGADIRTLNVWLALSDCGEDAPGLEVVPRRLDGIVETGTRGAHFDWSVGRDTAIDAAGESGLCVPRFRCGDALIFDQLMLHATYATPAMSRRRYAVESWFFAASAYPKDQVAIAI